MALPNVTVLFPSGKHNGPREYSQRADGYAPSGHHIRVDLISPDDGSDPTGHHIVCHHGEEAQHCPFRATTVHPEWVGASVQAENGWVGASCTPKGGYTHARTHIFTDFSLIVGGVYSEVALQKREEEMQCIQDSS